MHRYQVEYRRGLKAGVSEYVFAGRDGLEQGRHGEHHGASLTPRKGEKTVHTLEMLDWHRVD